ATDAAQRAYTELLEGLEKKFADVANGTLRRKQARQAARSVLPNATETRVVVTGNYRAWRHFIGMRATEHADVEIRRCAVACLRELQRVAPNVFGDFAVSVLADGTEVASAPSGAGGGPAGAGNAAAPPGDGRGASLVGCLAGDRSPTRLAPAGVGQKGFG